MGFKLLNHIRKCREARQKKIDAYHASRKKTTTVIPKAIEAEKPVQEPVAESIAATEKINSFVDNIINPENHQDQPSSPVVVAKMASSADAPTDDDDEESEEEADEKEDEADPVESNTAAGDNNSSVLNALSEESKPVETIQPPNSLKNKAPLDKEAMETFIEEQRAQQKLGFLCGCL